MEHFNGVTRLASIAVSICAIAITLAFLTYVHLSYSFTIAKNVYNSLYMGQPERESQYTCAALGTPMTVDWPVPYPSEVERTVRYGCKVSSRPPDFLVVGYTDGKVVFKGIYNGDGILDDAYFEQGPSFLLHVFDFLMITIALVVAVAAGSMCRSVLHKKKSSGLVSNALAASTLAFCIVLFAPISATCHVIMDKFLDLLGVW